MGQNEKSYPFYEISLGRKWSSIKSSIALFHNSSARAIVGNTSPELFNAAFKQIMSHLDWEYMVVKLDGRYPHHLRFADGIELLTPDIEQMERILAELDNFYGKIGLQEILAKMTS